jgi:NAD(P)-dependent dehydrogenase (short-subunit alcohol dehydrogenase family)
MTARRALVTGAGSGIGAACAATLAADGWDVVATDVNPGPGIAELDVVSEPGWDRVLAEAGHLDALVTCAGIRVGSMIVDTSLEQWQRHLDVNVTGTWLAIRGFLRQRQGQGEGDRQAGAIVTITSVNATIAVPGQAHYVASKGAIAALTRAAAMEAAPLGIRVNSIAPGPIRTPMAAPRLADEAQVRWLESRVPLGRVGEPPEIAATAAFLLSDASSYITGEVVYVDGGWAANAV